MRSLLILFISLVVVSVFADGGREKERKEVPKYRLPPEEVTVGAGYRLPQFRLPVTTDSIPSETIADLRPFTIDYLLLFVPGVDIQNPGLLSEKAIVNMRGMQGRYGCQRVLVLLDDIPLNEEYMGDVDFRFVPFEAIDRIEILRGPGSALYGGSAIAGVVRLKTIDIPTTPLLRFTSRLASFDTEYYSVIHASKYSRFRHLVTSSYARTEGYLLNSDGTHRDWEQATGYAKFEALISPLYILRISCGLASANGNQEDFTQNTTRDYESLSFFSHSEGRKVTDFFFSVFRNGTDNLYEWKFGADGNYYQQTLGAKWHITHRIKHFRLTAGGEYQQNRASVREYNGSLDKTLYTGSGFAQVLFQRGSVSLLLGLRQDKSSLFGGETSPRLAFSYLCKNRWLLRAAAGKAYRPPAISDLYLPPTLYAGMTFQGNPDLQPEHAWTYEIGGRRKTVLFERGKGDSLALKSDVTLFLTEAYDFFDYTLIDPSTLTFEPRNVTRTQITGVELRLHFNNILPKLNLLLNYTYNKAVYKRHPTDPSVEGNRVEYIPDHFGTAALDYTFGNGAKLILFCKASDHRNTDPQNYKRNNLPAYASFGVRFSSPLKLSTDKKGVLSSLFLSIDNLFDRKYYYLRGERAPRRAFSVGIEVRF